MGNLNKMFSEKSKNFCEFCEIINKKKELLIYDDDNIIVFHDIDKVSAVEHLLICPKNHISNTNSLDSKDIPLIEKIHKIGENILEQLRPNCSYRFGYHCPPLNSINHLHMHAFVLPIKNISKNLIMYGYMLTPPEKVIKKLQDKKKKNELKSD